MRIGVWGEGVHYFDDNEFIIYDRRPGRYQVFHCLHANLDIPSRPCRLCFSDGHSDVTVYHHKLLSAHG